MTGSSLPCASPHPQHSKSATPYLLSPRESSPSSSPSPRESSPPHPPVVPRVLTLLPPPFGSPHPPDPLSLRERGSPVRPLGSTCGCRNNMLSGAVFRFGSRELAARVWAPWIHSGVFRPAGNLRERANCDARRRPPSDTRGRCCGIAVSSASSFGANTYCMGSSLTSTAPPSGWCSSLRAHRTRGVNDGRTMSRARQPSRLRAIE